MNRAAMPRTTRLVCSQLIRMAAGFLLFVLLGRPSALAQERVSTLQRGPVTVRDVISMTRLGLPDAELSGRLKNRSALFSPDHSSFVIVLKKGNLDRNTNDYSVWLYRAEEAWNSPQGKLLFSLSSSSNREAVRELEWLRDGRGLAFIGENPGELPQIYEFSLASMCLKKMTVHPTPVVSFDASADGKTLLFEADPPPQKCPGSGKDDPASIAITSEAVSAFLACDNAEFHATKAEGEQLFLQKAGEGEVRIPVDADVLYSAPSIPRLSLSPDGRYGLVAGSPRTLPSTWAEYDSARLRDAIRSDKRRQGEAFLVPRHLVLEADRRELRPLFDTPAASPPQDVAWSDDGNSLFLSGVRLPLDSLLDADERASRTKNVYVVEVKFPQRDIREITSRDLRVKGWDVSGRRVLLSTPETNADGPEQVVAYAKEGSAWKEVVPGADWSGKQDRLEVTLEEDANSPPKIYAFAPGTGKKALLRDLNPQFSSLAFGRVEVITWKATDGHEVQGGLFFPPDYEPGKRYPLVIQTHGFLPGKFYIDGPWSSAFAAQPLAGRGIIVVQVGHSVSDDDWQYVNTPAEAPREMAAYEGVIDALDRRGLIDRDRVGIIGFSRTVYKVAYTLTHSAYRFAAATLADGIDGGYYEYILFQVENDPLLNGGPPFGQTLHLWVENAPEFRMDRVRTPVRLEAYGPVSGLGEWNWFSGLSLLGKPVDFIYLPHGTHLLDKPSERMVSQQGNVDWFCFWLKEEEDSNLTNTEQYKRWRELKKLQKENAKKQ